jgi:hypothetical protein
MNAIHAKRLFTATAVLAAVAALYATPSYAQSESAPLSRADVAAQTRAARDAGQLIPAGEGSPTDYQLAVHSDKTRAERKAETLAARSKGELAPGGLGLYKSNMSQQTAVAHSTKTRAERKAETQELAAQHKLMPAGEAADPTKI